MADAETQNTSTPALSNSPQAKSAVKKEKKAKNPRAKRSHPPTSEMVNNAIKGLKERGGSSLKAIKKYIAANYKVDAEKVTPFVKKYLKASVATGALMQTKGKGASGSFKLAASSKTGTSKPVKKTAAKKSSAVKTNKDVSGDKKSTTTKAAATQSNVSAGAAKTKYPTKEKKSNKGPTKKPKAPKPKTAKTAAASASPKAKKGAAPKKKILCLGS